MKNFAILILLIVSFGVLSADEKTKDEINSQRIISDLFDYHMVKAKTNKQVFVFAESSKGAAFVIYEKNFKNVLIHNKKRQVSISLDNASFQVFDKSKQQVQEFKYPKRFRSILVSRSGFNVRKKGYKGNYTHKITTSIQFTEHFYLKAKRTFKSQKDVTISLKIYDFRSQS